MHSPTRYELFCAANPYFFDSPLRLEHHSGLFDAAARPVASGWSKRVDGLWVRLRPNDVVLPCQGWKIHISARPSEMESTLEAVWQHCHRNRIAFKFVRSRLALLLLNGKYADRSASGKVLTIYPASTRQFSETLRALADQLEGVDGPYILSDLRHRAGPVFARYGAFEQMWCVTESGERAPAIRTPEGRYVPDVRQPTFSVPTFVSLPDVLKSDLSRRNAGSADPFPYEIERALHFSNGGGVYLARRPEDGERVVLREARPHAGLDGRGEDAVERLHREAEMLARLEGVDCAPRLIDQFIAWEHHFLVEEYVEGETLLDAIVSRYPLIHPDPSRGDRDRYARWVEETMVKLEEALDAVHGVGVTFGDLHPENVILRPDGRFVLVDWEVASTLDDERTPALRAPGFAAPSAISGAARDRHALGLVRLMALAPLVALLELCPEKRRTLVELACREFRVTGRVRRELLEESGDAPPASPICRPGESMFNERVDWTAIRDSLRAGIEASATPERSDRLFPGDPLQFSHGGATLAHGAAGVLLALAADGQPVPLEFVDWLECAAARPDTALGKGLYDGPHGVATVLDLLGRRDLAVEIVSRAADGADVLEPGLFRGRAGIALNLLHFGRIAGEPRFTSAAMRLAEELAGRLDRPERLWGAPGLFTGMTGAAVLFLHLYDDTREGRYLCLAEAALHRDLDRCVAYPNGTLFVRDGARNLAYLDGGSAGIGIVLKQYLQRHEHRGFADSLRAIRRACSAPFVLQPGLFQGRAGMLAALRDGRPTTAPSPAVSAHIRRLGWHAVLYDGHLAFPGSRLRRLSMDLATGSAGVLLALGWTLSSEAVFLPFLDVQPNLDDEGGDNARDPQAAGAD